MAAQVGSAVTLDDITVAGPKKAAPLPGGSTDPFTCTIYARGQVITVVESVTIRTSFHDSVSTFEFSTAESTTSLLQLQPGDPVRIYLGTQQVINGKVTTRSVGYDQGSHEILIAGKSLTKDIVDSSVPVKPGDYSGSTFQQIAASVLAPHGISLVTKNVPAIFSKPFLNCAVQYGETVHSLLSRLALMRGVFLGDDENGNLVAQNGNGSGPSVADLVEGQNILRAHGLLDDQTAFSEYTFSGQVSDPTSSTPQRFQSATATNPNASPNRKKLSAAEHPDDAEGMKARAGIESSRSQWPTVQITVTVVGWFKPDGTLWKPTENVSLFSPMIFPTNGGRAPPLGILSVTYSQNSQQGTTTTMTLVLPWLLTSSPLYGVQDVNAPDYQAQTAPGK